MNKGRFLKFWYILYINCSVKLYQPVIKSKWFYPRLVSSLLTALPPFFVIKALSPKEQQKAIKDLIHSADSLYKATLYDELYELLYGHEGSQEPEILWRLARSLYEKSRSISSEKDKLETLEKALEIVTRCLELDGKCGPAHRWRAILLDFVWRHKSTKGRIMQSFACRYHMEKAVEFDPNDSTAYYMLGEWCYTFADMPWYQRKAAAVLFTSPPTSTFEEAYSYYQKAEELNPGFYSMNLLMLGKCLLKLNEKDQAIDYLKKAYAYPIKTLDDKQAHAEACKLLKELGEIS